MSDVQVPPWAARARRTFRALLGLNVALWLILMLLDLIVDDDILNAGSFTWLDVVRLALVALCVVSGLIWLAGATVAGYRESHAG